MYNKNNDANSNSSNDTLGRTYNISHDAIFSIIDIDIISRAYIINDNLILTYFSSTV